MGLTAIASVASFSAVLAETFAAVGLSTIVPNLFIAATKAARGAAGPGVTPELLEKLRKLSAEAPPAAGAAPSAAYLAAVTDVRSAYAAAGNPAPDPSVAEDVGGMFADGAIKKATELIKTGARSIDHLDVLVPTKASIDAEFEFHASEKYTAEAGIGAAIEMVTIKAGFSALYEASSRNKVTLHVEFGLVGVDL